MDLSESSQVRKFADDVLAKYKTVDVLVNNAGMGTPSGSGPVEGRISALTSHLTVGIVHVCLAEPIDHQHWIYRY